MRYRLVLLLLLTAPCFGQTNSTGKADTTAKAETTGACSPAVTGNNNQFTITCQGIPEKLRAQLVDLLNLVAKNHSDAATVLAKLDSCVSGVSLIVEKETPRHLTSQQKEFLVGTLSQFKGKRVGTIVNNSKWESREFLADLQGALTASGWDVYEQGIMMAGAEPTGILIIVGEKDVNLPFVQGLARAFAAIGIAEVKLQYQPEDAPADKYMFGKIKPGEILLQVGDKP
jgi:hypothetical protein